MPGRTGKRVCKNCGLLGHFAKTCPTLLANTDDENKLLASIESLHRMSATVRCWKNAQNRSIVLNHYEICEILLAEALERAIQLKYKKPE